ncbi:MAG: hypothetical protein OQL08_08990 [Gammaproteobacteria bacterium]|nr:hypothetical protein [Gammaproteobacteria bacterium]
MNETTTPETGTALAGRDSSVLLCDQCRDTGEKVVFDDRFAEGYAIVFCNCIHGKTLAAVQSETLSDHGA